MLHCHAQLAVIEMASSRTGKRLQAVLHAHSTARLVFPSGLGKVCVFVHILNCFHCSCQLCPLALLQAYVLGEKKKSKPTNFVALPDHILLIDSLSFWFVLL